MRIKVKHECCHGHAMCVFTAPEIFELDRNGYNRMEPFDVKPGEEGMVTSAANSCPEEAIEIIEN